MLGIGRKKRTETEFALALVKQLVVPTFVLDADGQVLVWNDACADLTGISAADVVGTRAHWRGFYPEQRPCLADVVLNAATGVHASYANIEIDQSGGVGRAENWCDLPKGVRRYLAIDAKIIRDAQGKVMGVVETVRDLTERKEAQTSAAASDAARRESAEQLRGVVERLAQGLKSLAKGRLDWTFDEFFPEDYKRIRMDFNQAIAELNAAMQEIRNVSEVVAQSSDRIARGADQLAQRAEHQAATLEQTAAAHDQITATVSKTREVSRAAADQVRRTHEHAMASRRVVEESVDAIESIKSSSESISQITGVIDEIAFQTNLLALNAGVEAARAGEAGRGFAIVASEVRALAQRSAQAAKEIKGLIQTSSEAVEHGVKLVRDTGQTLHEIIGDISGVTSRVQDIASASEEQAIALAEVNKALAELDIVTQENAAIAGETAGACADLTEQALKLATAVCRFAIQDGDDRSIDLDKAAAAHLEWKAKLLRAAETGETLDVRTIAADDCCALGKWLRGEAKRLYGDDPALARPAASHARFHCEAGHVAEAVNRGATRQAIAMVEAGTPFAQASREVGTALAILRQRKAAEAA